MGWNLPVVAVVPARGGSVGLPGKNLATVGGKSLVHRAVTVAFEAGIDHVWVSTDDEAIGAEGARAGAAVAERHPSLAAADTATIDVLLDLIETGPIAHYPDEAVLVCLEPTTPLREATDVSGTVSDLLACPDAHAAVTVTPFAMSPRLAAEIGPDGRFLACTPEAYQRTADQAREAQPLLVHPNGAVYAVRFGGLRSGRSFWDPAPLARLMPAERSVDIDSLIDLHLAELMATGTGANES